MKTSTNPKPRFKLLQFTNRGGSASWRVAGIKRDGTRIRENFSEVQSAKCRLVDLESEFLARAPEESRLRATRLTDNQIHLAEILFPRLKADGDLVSAVDFWLRHGQESIVKDAPRLDEAFAQFKSWLDTADMRDLSKTNLRQRINLFVNSSRNNPVSEISQDAIDAFLAGRAVSHKTRDNDRRAVSRFFSWCMERPRKWIATNPCRKEKGSRTGEASAPEVLTLSECERLLKAAATHRNGRLAPYVALCLFGGLRPFEAARVTWPQINLKDRELRLESNQTKTKQPRVVAICDTLAAWLEAYKDNPIFPENWRRDFDIIKAQSGFGNIERLSKDQGKGIVALKPWPVDVMRHTAISHYFRNTGSYGRTAEQFGNSEAIIKKHYAARVSTEDTKRFYSILPRTRKPAKKS